MVPRHRPRHRRQPTHQRLPRGPAGSGRAVRGRSGARRRNVRSRLEVRREAQPTGNPTRPGLPRRGRLTIVTQQREPARCVVDGRRTRAATRAVAEASKGSQTSLQGVHRPAGVGGTAGRPEARHGCLYRRGFKRWPGHEVECPGRCDPRVSRFTTSVS